MKLVARWAWVVVLGTALALSWWSLDALARRYGMPGDLAAMVSATFDGAALVAADLAIRQAKAADSAVAVKLLMLTAVGLSAWLNFEHGALLHYPLAIRVLFASPSVISGSLFEMQLRSLHRSRLRELGRVAQPLPPLGTLVWVLHPFAALRRVSQITASRLHSVPLSVIDWQAAPMAVQRSPKPPVQSAPRKTVSEAAAGLPASAAPSRGVTPPGTPVTVRRRGGRSAVPDELYASRLREHIRAAGGVVPSAREAARLLSIGQDRARRLVGQVANELENAALP